MDELICRAMHGNASEEEEAQLQSWRAESGLNDLQYRATVSLLREITTAQQKDLDPAPPLGKLLGGGAGWSRGWAGRAMSLRGLIGAGLVTSAAAAIAALTVVTFPRLEPNALAAAAEARAFVTGSSEAATITLHDGTVVRLAPSSTLRVSAEPGAREVWVEGRAYFAVAEDPSRPFRIRTPAGDAVVLGTRFDLAVSGDQLRLLVIEGSVGVEARGELVRVEANEFARLNRSSPLHKVEADSRFIETELSWLDQFIAFQNTPLGLAARELTQHYGVPVEVVDETLAQETVTGAFHEERLEDVVRVVCRALAIRCQITPSRVTIGTAAPPTLSDQAAR